MIGQIGPLVQEGKKKRIVGAHVAGGLLGGATIGVALGFLGLLLLFAPASPIAFGLGAVTLTILVYGALVDLGMYRLPQLTSQRQTPGWWPCAMGPIPGVFAWGFDLGLAVSTRLPYQTALFIPAAALAVHSLPVAVVIMSAYGSARAIVVGTAIVKTERDVQQTCDLITHREPWMRRTVGCAAILIAVVVVAAT